MATNLEQKLNHFGEELIDKLNFFRKDIYNPENVFYPCCADNIAPYLGFPESNVTFLDKDKSLSELMKECDINFIADDVHNYNPKTKNDLVLILHPLVKSKTLVKSLKSGGYVLSNDYHGNASQLMKNDEFKYKGLINKNSEDKFYLSKKDMSGLNTFSKIHVFKKR